MDIRETLDLLETSSPKLKWWSDGPNEESWLAADYFDPPIATVSPEWRATRGHGQGKPDLWIATKGTGERVGQATTRAAAQKLIK